MAYRLKDPRRGIIGPIGEDTLRDLIAAGVLDKGTLISRDGGPFLEAAEFSLLGLAESAQTRAPTYHSVIGERSVKAVLMDLYRDRASGLLAVHDGDIHNEIYLRDGRLCFVAATKAERIGERLVRYRKLEQSQLEEALVEMRRAGARLGDTLVRLGMVEHETLLQEICDLQIERLIEICCWQSGELDYYEGHPLELDTPDIPMSIPELIVRAAREMPEAMLESVLGEGIDQKPDLFTPPDAIELPLDDDERRLLVAFDGGLTTRQIAETVGRDRGDRGRVLQLVYLLREAGALELT